jgi:HSP20 family protein
MAQNPTTQKNVGGQLAARGAQPLQRLHHGLNTVFDRMLSGWLAPFDRDLGSMRLWDFDVTEDDKEIVIRAEIPGFEENELDIQLNNDMLTIKAEKTERENGKEEYRNFFRSVTLPGGIDAEKVQATYRNGVLEMHIPRAEGAQPKRIKVEGSQKSGNGSQGQQAGTKGSSKAKT